MERNKIHSGKLALSIFLMIAGLYLLNIGYTFTGLAILGAGIWLFGVTI
ncbi:MAG: hypothetical protein AABX86_03220 [Nanoarchaeota archaeon]